MDSSRPAADLYSIPSRLRRLENLHILFWLLKDMSWCLNYKIAAVCMIIPTLAVAIYICHRNRHIITEWYHNLAVIFWISANSTWMIFEFIGRDEAMIFGGLNGREMALIPFGIGLVILLYYYLSVRTRNRSVGEEAME
jgi:hypothetical protein